MTVGCDKIHPLADVTLTAARGAGLAEKDFAAVFHLLARISGVTA